MILRVIEGAPRWLRHELEAKEAGARHRAEKTSVAMIADTIVNETPEPSQGKPQIVCMKF